MSASSQASNNLRRSTKEEETSWANSVRKRFERQKGWKKQRDIRYTEETSNKRMVEVRGGGSRMEGWKETVMKTMSSKYRAASDSLVQGCFSS